MSKDAVGKNWFNLELQNGVRYSNPAGTPIPDVTAPSVPVLTATAVSSSQINISWTASTDNYGVTGYTLQRSLDNVTWTTLKDSLTLSHVESGRPASTLHYYRVRAYDAAGNQSAWATAQVTTFASGGTWLDSVGLLWADGVEPSGNEDTLYPVQAGNRVWYVDANAASNGDGSSGSPFWSFVEINTGTSLSGYTPGDHIYVTGDFTATKQAVRGAMGPDITSTAWAGSRTNPTVIRSWPGRSRAKFDGEFSATNMVDFALMASGASAADRGLVVINVECTRNWGISLYSGGNSYWGLCRVISCYAHDCIGSGPASSMGGIHVGVRIANCDAEVRNCETAWNFYNSDGTLNYGTLDNTAGTMFHFGIESVGAVVKYYNNYAHHEYRCVSHKWSGVGTFLCYNNKFENAHGAAIRIRNANVNTIHNNLSADCNTFIAVTDGNRVTQANMKRDLLWYSNTIVGSAVEAYWDDGGETNSYLDTTVGYDNIFYNPSLTSRHILLEQYSNTSFYSAGLQYDSNCIFASNSAAYAEVNNVNYTRAGFVVLWPDTGSIYVDPLFTNPAAGDYTLQSGSPAAGKGAF